ncbi:zonular occludens toxin domain-containing protein [Aquabacterium sp. A3]|uniref:zonular occludens toxin domain-containing protein n=1 Tax=Aquabacterium sp. A3 TaxID=3132829 RepID=UPI003119CD0C
MSAPVTLMTGLPRNGKTLHAICMLKERSEKEKRQVYYHGIEILDKVALPWQELVDATKWYELPIGSLIVIDEAHKVFPVRPVGSKVPPHVEAIAELGHYGHDIVIITQHPMELDSAIRRRVGRHIHHVRRFGLEACAMFEWSRCVENCDKTRKDAIQHEWRYNKAAYAWYKSSELHTIKRNIPKKLLILPLALLLIIAAIWYVVHVFTKQRDGGGEQPQPQQAPITSTGDIGARPAGPANPVEWFEAHQPRIRGLAYTAPVYDQVTQPVRAPYPAACIQSATKCQCYTQQGTRLDVPKPLCQDIAAGGFFVAWQLEGQPGQGSRTVNAHTP